MPNRGIMENGWEVYDADTADRDFEEIVREVVDDLYGDDFPCSSPEEIVAMAVRRWKGEEK